MCYCCFKPAGPSTPVRIMIMRFENKIISYMESVDIMNLKSMVASKDDQFRGRFDVKVPLWIKVRIK